jgi:ketosteroid isomerase-like protein
METTAPAGGFATPQECEAAFYAAFRAGDLGAMQRVWGADSDIVCVHPGRPPLAGRRAVMQSWREIFESSGGLAVKFDCQRRATSRSLAVHMGIEIIGAGNDEPALVAVTNVYGLTDQGWRMITHHAGPIPRSAEPRPPIH